MRPLLATAATALAVSVVTSGVFAQKTKTDAARESRAEATGSLKHSYDRCVSLARQLATPRVTSMAVAQPRGTS
jgi:hypothetical protein